MEAIIFGLLGVIIGFMLIKYRVSFARYLVDQQNSLWWFHFGNREARISEIVAVIVGAGFFIVGLLLILGLAKFKS